MGAFLRLSRVKRSKHLTRQLFGGFDATAELGRLILIFLYMAHICGCLYWFTSVAELVQGAPM